MMSSDSGVEDRANVQPNPSLGELRKLVTELTKNSQELLTEKLFLENEVNQLKKLI